MTIRFDRIELRGRFLSPDGREEVMPRLEIRRDPLLGTSARIAEGVVLQKGDAAALETFQSPATNCPFCAGRVEQVTPRILPAISAQPRIRRGDTLLFPNLVPYSQYAAVAAFTPAHFFQLSDFTPERLRDNLAAVQDYIKRVRQFDRAAMYCGYSINYLYPSGGSLPHPHAQVFVDPQPTTRMRMEMDAAASYLGAHHRGYWEDLVREETKLGERFIAQSGRVTWMTPFAPLGFNQVDAVVSERNSLLDLDDNDLLQLGIGIARVLRWYEGLGYNSFNLALYSGLGASDISRVHLSMITRSALVPYYRSDAMYMERLHWEAAVDRAPEAIAAELRAGW